jgi:hypothetical protein
VFYSLIGALKATGLNKAILPTDRGKDTVNKDSIGEWQVERTALEFSRPAEDESEVGASQQSGMPAPTLEAEIGALIKKAGNSLRGQPNKPQGPPATFSSNREPAPGSLTAIHQREIAIPAESLWDNQIATGDGNIRAIGLTVAVLAALGLGWISGWGSYHFFASSHSDNQLASAPATSPASNLGSECATRCIMRPKTNRETTASIQNVVSPATTRGPAQPVSGPRTSASLGAPPAPTGQHQMKILPRSKPAPTLDTPPTTIPGWTIREVVGTSIVLEGPNGVSKVARGDTVAGLGRIDSIVRWGNRWIVVTSRGLITTQ